MATSLIQSEPDDEVNEEETNIDSPANEFFEAMLENDIEKVKAKIAEGFTALSRSPSGGMALHFACLNSKLDVLRLLKDTLKEGEINTINIEEDDSICGTALHMSMDGQVDPLMAKTLLFMGADPNALDAKGSPVLHELIYRAFEDLEENFKFETYMKSIRNSNNEESEESTGTSYFEKLKLLYEHGANMNLVNSGTSLSPLHFWCQNFQWSMEKFLDLGVPDWCIYFLDQLLKYGADVNAESKREETPMAYMAQRCYKPYHTNFMETYRKALLRLLPRLSDINRGDMFGRTLLHLSTEFSNYILLEELLNFPCDLNIPDKFYLSPMHLITHNVTTDEKIFVQKIVDILIKNGANVDIQDKHGSTPLHHAVHMNNHTAIQHLLDHRASVEIRDKFDRTVKDLARIEGDSEVHKMMGIVDQLHEDEILSTVSGVRLSRFYPLCCHKTYSEDLRGVEEPEVVTDTDIDKWLEKYPLCIHNTKATLQNSIPSLETNMEQRTNRIRDAMSMKKEIYRLLQNVAGKLGSYNPLFQSQIIFGGSVSEGTKVGCLHEMDFVFDLFKIRQIVEVVEDQQLLGFARLKVLCLDEFVKYGLEDLVDNEGFLNRSATSNSFHKHFEKCFQSKEIWCDSQFFSWWGTTNSLGDCANIGQLSLIWYGPFEKRQIMNIDIVPVVRLSDWQTAHVNSNLRIVDKQTAMSVGCYLIMKDPTPFLDAADSLELNVEDCAPTEANAACEQGDLLFKLSLSQLEHATMKFLPSNIKNGYKIAKSIQLQCPKLSLSIEDVNTALETSKESLRYEVNVDEYITSFVLKTCMFYELDSQGIVVKFNAHDLSPGTWNDSVLNSTEETQQDVAPNDLTEAVSWALLIYKRLWTLLEEKKRVPEYFMPVMKATKILLESETFIKICRYFLKIIIHFLEHIQIPDDFMYIYKRK